MSEGDPRPQTLEDTPLGHLCCPMCPSRIPEGPPCGTDRGAAPTLTVTLTVRVRGQVLSVGESREGRVLATPPFREQVNTSPPPPPPKAPAPPTPLPPEIATHAHTWWRHLRRLAELGLISPTRSACSSCSTTARVVGVRSSVFACV